MKVVTGRTSFSSAARAASLDVQFDWGLVYCLAMRNWNILAIAGLSSIVPLAGCATGSSALARAGSVQSARDDSTRPAAPAAIRQAWVEAELVAEIRRGLDPLLPGLGWDTPRGRTMVNRILPAAFSERLRVEPDAAERRLAMATDETPPSVQAVTRWFERCYWDATTRGFSDMGGAWPQNPGTIDPLPEDPALRVVIAMQTDWLGVWGLHDGPRFERKSKGTMDGPESPEQRAARAGTIAACREEGAAVIAEALARAVASPAFAGERVQLLGLLIVRLDRRDFDTATHLRAADLYAARTDADPWLAALYRGVVLQDRAWLARGEDTLGNTTPEQLALFQRGLDEAYGPLTEAHRLAPHRPHAAGVLVGHALGTSNPRHETPESWFQLATGADPTWFDAYNRLTYTTLDRWGGTARDRLSLLRRMRHAARQPGGGAIAMLAPGLLAMARADDSAIMADPATLEEFQACLRPLWKTADATTAARTGVDPDEAWSLALVIARQARDAAGALAILDEPGRTFITPDRDDFKAAWTDLLRWALERHPSDGPAYTRMNAAVASGDLAKAATLATDLAASAKSPRTVEAARGVLAVCDLDRRLAAGETIDIADPVLRPFWTGSASVLAKSFAGEAISLGNAAVASGESTRAFFPGRLSGRYRVEVEIQLPPRDPKRPTGPCVWFDLGPEPRDPKGDRRVVRLMAANEQFQLMGGIKSQRRDENLGVARAEPLHQLVIDVDSPRAHVRLNGVLWDVIEAVAPPPAPRGAYSPPAPPPVEPKIGGVFGIDTYATNPGQVIRISAIRISRPAEPLADKPLERTK